MRLVHDAGHDVFAEEVEAALHVFARGVAPDQPDWDQLVERSGGSVTLLPSAKAAVVADRWRLGPAPLSFVAAALIAAVLAGALLVNRTPGATPLEQVPASISAPAPTDESFDATAAPAVWSSGTDDPVAATRSYLESAGLRSAAAPAAPSAPGGPPSPGAPAIPSEPGDTAAPALELTIRELVDGVAVVDWSVTGSSYTSTGVVILRASDEAGATVWSVVGSGSDDVELDDIRYDGENLSFGVTRTSDVDGPVAVGVWADGRPLPLGHDLLEPEDTGGAGVPVETSVPATGAAPAGAAVGELIDLGAAPGLTEPVVVAVDDAAMALVRVQHFVDGQLVSVTEMAIDLTGSGTGGDAGTARSTEAEAEADTRTPEDVSHGDGSPPPVAPSTPEPSVPDLPDDDPETLEPGLPLPVPSGPAPSLPEKESPPLSLPPWPTTTLGLLP
jgi:hypothetical protein